MPNPTTPESKLSPKKSSRVVRRRLPSTPGGFSINFCRNSTCERFGIFPDPLDGRGRPSLGQARGKISGAGEDRTYICPACNRSSIVKSNQAVMEEYARLRQLTRRTNQVHCSNLENDHMIYCLEVTVSKTAKHTLEACKKLCENVRSLRGFHPEKGTTGWYVTRFEPTGDLSYRHMLRSQPTQVFE